MLVSRKVFDSLAAFSCGVGTILIATGVKAIPSVISYLGLFAFGWGMLMVIGCFGAGIGALLRNRGTEPAGAAFQRRVWSVRLERICWPAIAWAALVFAIGVCVRIGPIDGATTIGWTGFVLFTCAGHWWVIRRARKGRL